MKTVEKVKAQIKSPKVQAVLGLAVGTLAWLAPDDTSAYCTQGNLGDCERTTSGFWSCIEGDINDDCR